MSLMLQQNLLQHGLTIKNKSKIIFYKAYRKLAINFLLYSCFFNISNCNLNKSLEYALVLTLNFLQLIYFLITMRINSLLGTKKRQKTENFFGNLFCFIDDLCAIKHYLEFDKNYTDIYLFSQRLKNVQQSLRLPSQAFRLK